MPGIFISYRRDAAGHAAGRLHDRLRDRFGRQSVLFDIEIEPGTDFVQAIEQSVSACDVVLVLISRDWIDCVDAAGTRRLHNAGDFVRQEIATALKRKLRLIPILIDGAAMPAAEALPDELQPLTTRQAVEVRHSRWDADVDRLVVALEKVVKTSAESDVGTARVQLSQLSVSYSPTSFIESAKKGDAYVAKPGLDGTHG